MSQEEKLFDEFGNYYGDVDDSDESEDSFDMADSKEENFLDEEGTGEKSGEESDGDAEQGKLVLFEDKKYYPELGEAYPEAKVMIEEEDAMDIDQPILPPPKKQDYNYTTKTHLEGNSLWVYLCGMSF